ncbi:glycosyltransferase family 2 protein [Thermospira aquatica]|uniref:Glycosyltransferase family 2 protein n=1 Tax=Thermospira aquatica TaxID=2828656 RepID=A0AAX3BFH3_9SPIR|nr:glycosyltransferase family 2 protein [Thermospira aquatica]URA10863.1 glycosyltransferase family 2 protein [Thermospira aquatica]
MEISKPLYISVIIVNYNTRELTLACLASLYSYTEGVSFEVIVVDNASNDGSGEAIRKHFPQTKLIINSENLGFGVANNIGIQHSRGKYIFMLNSDTLLKNNALKIFYDFMEAHPEIGACGGWLKDTQGKTIHSYGRFPYLGWQVPEILRDGFLLTLELPFLRWLKKLRKQKKNSINVNTTEETTEIYPVDYIVGADFFVRKSVLDQVGLFDPYFFLYFEETDLQYRMAQKNIPRVLIKEPFVVHLEGQSSSPKSMRSYTLSKVSALRFYRKHYGFLRSAVLWVVYILVAGWIFFINLFVKRYSIKETWLHGLSMLTVDYAWVLPFLKKKRGEK